MRSHDDVTCGKNFFVNLKSLEREVGDRVDECVMKEVRKAEEERTGLQWKSPSTWTPRRNCPFSLH